MCSIIPHYVLPVSRSNVLNYLDTRLARKGKEEMIRSSLEKSIDFASHRHISGHRLRSLSQWYWKQKQLARRPVFHPDLVKILLGRVRGGRCPSLFIFIRHLCWELLALRTSLRIWEESPLKWGCWVRGNSSEGPASPGAERPQVSVSTWGLWPPLDAKAVKQTSEFSPSLCLTWQEGPEPFETGFCSREAGALSK